jgi:L-glyceraldehyde 3-phosphate reductase
MLTPELLAKLKEWNAEAEAQGLKLSERALRWILEQRGVTSVLVGASSPEQLARNLNI